MFDKINVRYLKLAGLALGVVGAGIASLTQSKEIEKAVSKQLDEKLEALVKFNSLVTSAETTEN